MNHKLVHTRPACLPWSRARGLILRPELPAEVALHLRPCWCIHTCFMRRCIDVVFLDAGSTILRVVEGLGPWRIAGHARARSVLEFNAGDARRLGLQPGDVLVLRCGRDPHHAAF